MTGDNELIGTIPGLSTQKSTVSGTSLPDCSSFPNPFVKLERIWSTSHTSQDIVPFMHLKILSLCESS